jgi:hypothetical protein
MMDLTANGQVLTGTWTEENTGPWSLELVASSVTAQTMKEYSRPVTAD